MSKYARCDKQGTWFRVADICDDDPFKFYYPTIAQQFQECPNDVQLGYYRWTDGTYSRYKEPYYKTRMTRYEFLTLFTIEERSAIRTASKTDPVIEDILALLSIAEDIDTTNSNTLGSLDYLVSKNLLTAERAAEIKKGYLVRDEE